MIGTTTAGTGTTGTRHRPPEPRERTGPLAGLRVVELSSFVATPLCGMTLAQLGADVVRVEPLGGGPDRTRWPLAADGTSLYWSGLNRGKQALAVDLTRPEGRALVADLVVGAGCEEDPSGAILVTNTERWPELSAAALRERRPDLVHVLLTGRHDGGAAVDYTVQAGTGFAMVTGPGDHGGPINHVLPAWDLAAGLYLATGLLAADRERGRTGQGRNVRVALEDVALATAGHLGYLAEAQLDPAHPRERDGNHVFGTFGRDFTSADGARIMIVALTSRQWSDLLRASGLVDVVAALGRSLAVDLDDEGERYRHREVLAALVATWVGRLTAEEVETSLRPTRVLWSRYRTFADLAADDARLLREHPLFTAVDEPGSGRYLAPGSPMTLDGHRASPRPSPRVGQDTDGVLAAMGVSAERRARLARDGLVAATAGGPASVSAVSEDGLTIHGPVTNRPDRTPAASAAPRGVTR